jgi:hypothetical protein
LRVFANKGLRRNCGPEREEGTGERRKIHCEEVNDMCFSSNFIRLFK